MLTLDRRRLAGADWSITRANGSNVTFGSEEPFEIWREFPRYRQTFALTLSLSGRQKLLKELYAKRCSDGPLKKSVKPITIEDDSSLYPEEFFFFKKFLRLFAVGKVLQRFLDESQDDYGY
ncbi:hypothetical protein RB195_023118 [Necator americanus]|uniref:Uncharacterized protein n=1 Tax=Necator americanus TaxID=51031 RepID=A0ABR1EI00_NECAM